jgi:hypothetical protein
MPRPRDAAERIDERRLFCAGARTGGAETGSGVPGVSPVKKAIGPAIIVVAAVSLLAALLSRLPRPGPPDPIEKLRS